MTRQSKAAMATTLLTNGIFCTINPAAPFAEALAIGDDGKIIAVGKSSEVRTFASSTTRIVDLRGRFVMPGIIDFHMHALKSMALRLNSVALDAANTFEEILARVDARASQPDAREWLIGSAFGAVALAEMEAQGTAARARLDAVSHGRPVILDHVSAHGSFANTLALSRGGVDRSTENPADGEIVKDARTGEPTGLLHETAAWLVHRANPPFTKPELVAIARQAVEMFNSIGITGFCDASSALDDLNAFRALDDAGELTCWAGFNLALSATCPGYRAQDAEYMLAHRNELCGPHMIAEAAKIFLDGVPSLRTAAMLEPYARQSADDKPHDGGAMSRTLEELTDEIAEFDRRGLSVKVHAIGDRAVRTVLDAVEKVRSKNGAQGPQHHIAHGQFIRSEDIPRLKQLNVLADLNPPLWFPNSASVTHRRLIGADRYQGVWPIRRILESGADAAAGSDWITISPTLDPWQALAGMITRKDPTGVYPETHGESEAISLEQALPLYTRNAARAMRLGDRTGSLKVGLSCDAIVLDRNLFEIAPQAIAETKVITMLFEGRVVYGAL